jgi:hypothetical protein
MIEAATERTRDLAEKLGLPVPEAPPEPPDYETHAAVLAEAVRLILSGRQSANGRTSTVTLNPQWRRLCEVHLADYDQAVARYEEERDA